MIPWVDAAVALGGLILPPAYDFLKKKFIKPENDSTEATISGLATTSPETIPQYLEAVTGNIDAKIRWFNRDVIATPSQWVVDMRAGIRPLTVVCGMAMLAFIPDLDAGTRCFLEANISSWFGSRLTKSST